MEIDELDVVLLDQLDDVLRGCHSAKSPEQGPAVPADFKIVRVCLSRLHAMRHD